MQNHNTKSFNLYKGDSLMGRHGTIANRKASQDSKRAQIFTKYARAITVAARNGGGDPDYNIALKHAIDRAKSINMPNDNINRAIKKGTGELAGEMYEPGSFEGYGAKIIQERSHFIEKLNVISRDISTRITNSKEKLEISYESNVEKKESLAEQKYYLKKALSKNIKYDIFRRNTSVGPHKDDMILTIEGIDIRRFGSQGQQRTAALSLKLAEIKMIKEETGFSPILLLDDVLSELDQERQKFLIESMEEVQLFITTTELNEELKKHLWKGKIFLVEKGKVTKMEKI